ncbi:molybdopterin synthase catalytic subunit MoaE [Candidatus Sodalis endolongispinus]|uniref:Molybdopterin synthase catalytic subunit n=1 Tax=Candidatus Sodalis endolongispinus TaxID=2812662 RepID=A0ABS5YEL4_9GAMM|nr:molybdopterin synthase catalytic subunit MoaE [Candidatus Sodalis endolongispinus]MBT9433393.1 molybdopterin synthase catalytic subunit MoaE [Candidatus Sodalis endolongispinus]
MEATLIEVGAGDFDVAALYAWLYASDNDGAVVTFTGKVRSHNLCAEVSKLTLEHYPDMTEKALADIAAQARERWPLTRIALLHRVGELGAGERIVFVGVSGAHRAAAFSAAEYMMDILKTLAPFWKRESTPAGSRWLDARVSDQRAAERWQGCSPAGETDSTG